MVGRKWGFLALVGATALVMSATSCTYIYGDSLTDQARFYKAIKTDGVAVQSRGGTAPCDWLDQMPKDQAVGKPTTVILAFVGNSGTPCMVSSWRGNVLNVDVAVSKYEAALRKARTIFPKAKLIIIRPPAVVPFWLFGSPKLDAMYVRVSRGIGATYCQAAYNTLTPGGKYLPQYRANDGLHLNEAGAKLYGRALTACGG